MESISISHTTDAEACMQADLQLAAAEAIMDCMLFAIDSPLASLKERWSGPLPMGLQVLLASKDVSPQSHAALTGHRAGLKLLKSKSSDQAVQVRSQGKSQAHIEVMQKLHCRGLSLHRSAAKSQRRSQRRHAYVLLSVDGLCNLKSTSFKIKW